MDEWNHSALRPKFRPYASSDARRLGNLAVWRRKQADTILHVIEGDRGALWQANDS